MAFLDCPIRHFWDSGKLTNNVAVTPLGGVRGDGDEPVVTPE